MAVLITRRQQTVNEIELEQKFSKRRIEKRETPRGKLVKILAHKRLIPVCGVIM